MARRRVRPSAAPLVIPKEMSWLVFNDRVLDQADEDRHPLLDRIRFLGIFSNNLDEFYRVRVATLRRAARAEGGGKRIVAGVEISRLLKDIRKRVVAQSERFAQIAKRLLEQLENEGVHLVNEGQLDAEQAEQVREIFQTQVRPRLVPILCYKSRDLPTLRDPFLYLAVELITSPDKGPSYAFIEVPTDCLPRFLVLRRRGDQDYVILLEDVIRFNLREIFALFDPVSVRAWTVKITRDAELDLEGDETDTFLDRVQEGLRKRRVGLPVRLLYDERLPEPFLQFVAQKMRLEHDEALIAGQRYHNFKDFMRFPSLGRSHLLRAPAKPILHPRLVGRRSVLEVLGQGDLMLHTPYHSFASFVDFLREAAIDPKVTHIRMTMYRVSQNSSVLNALINAARNGKQVTVVVELLARFDEENNLEWVDRLRDVGVEVITGVQGLKVHAKLCLVTRRTGRALAHFACIGTGNFNEETARLYTDHLLMTAVPEITEEVLKVFEFFGSNFRVGKYGHLIVCPFQARRTFRRLLRNEVRIAKRGRPAFFWGKLNNLADERIIEELYAASAANVDIRLIVRAMNSLIGGVPGHSEHIECRSLVGRYLEHTRFLIFGNGGDPLVFLTSGDWMARNFDGRVEVGCPIRDPQLKRELFEYFSIQWRDTENARIWDTAAYQLRPRPTQPQARLDAHEAIREYLSGLAAEAPTEPMTGSRG